MQIKRKLAQFEDTLQKGRYLFHIHTDWTDGKNNLSEFCVVAKKHNFQSIILAEHIRRANTYDFESFLELIEEQRLIHGIEIIPGVETKILPGGFLDISDCVLSNVQVVAIAEHSFQGDQHMLADSLCNVFKAYANVDFACIWAHPGLKLLRYSMGKSLFLRVMDSALNNNVYIELNLKYNMPPASLLNLISASRIIVGMDAHSVQDIEKFAEMALNEEKGLSLAIMNESK